MSCKPILFSGEMVRAILEGRKNQTRRIIKGDFYVENDPPLTAYIPDYIHGEPEIIVLPCPYGKVGDRLWVRETFAHLKPNSNEVTTPDKIHTIAYKATDSHPEGIKWKPSIFMPRRASRIILEITEIRIEELQDISEEDAIGEGIRRYDELPSIHPFGLDARWGFGSPRSTEECYSSAKYAFAGLWNSINGKKHPWDSNHWVWVIRFKRLSPPEV